MNQERTKRMESKLKEIITSKLFELTAEIQSDFWIINVNWVKISPDMSYLDVLVSSIKSQDTLCKALAVYAQELKQEINKNITLRKTPIIRFRYDNSNETTIDLLSKIEALKIN